MFINAGSFFSRLLKIFYLLACLVSIILTHSCKHQTEENPEHTLLINSILDNANSLLNSGEIKKAENYLDSAYNSIPKPGIIDLWKKYEHKVNIYLMYERNIEKASLYADSMILVLKDKSETYPGEYAKSIFSRSEVLMAQKRYTEAFNSYYTGKTFASKYLDSCESYEFSYQLGLAKYKQAEYLQAAKFFKQSFAEAGSCPENSGFEKTVSARQRNLNNIALCYERVKMPDSAIFYYQQALTILEKNAAKFPSRKHFIEVARGVIFGNLGGAYASLKLDSVAENFLLESIKLNDRPGFDLRDVQTAKLKLASLYIKTGRLKESKNLLDQLETYLFIPENNKAPVAEHIRLQFYKIKWNYYDQTAQTPFAYKYAVKYNAFQDSITRVNEGLEDVDMDQIFKDAEQRHKLELLHKDNQLKQGFLIGAIIISILAFSVLGVVWLNLKNSKMLNRKMTEQNKQMQMTLHSLQQSQDENTRIMKVVAHDLRSPMAATVSIATMLLDQENMMPDDKEILELMRTSNLHSLDMISDLLNMNTTALGLKKEHLEVQILLYECIELMKFKADEKNQTIILHSLDQIIYVNREKIWRVFSNLIVNAIKFSPEGSTIDISMELHGDHIQVKIKDQGIGIPDDLKDKIFNMFTDARRTGTAGEQSFGLGLAISRQIIEAHGGKIWFESDAQIGTTFYLELPIETSVVSKEIPIEV